MEGASGLDLSCPVCICKGFSSPESLARHVEEHFDAGIIIKLKILRFQFKILLKL